MKRRALVVACLLSVFVFALAAESRGEEAPLQIQGGDTVKSLLERSAGQTVALRVGSGDEIRGKVVKVGDHVVHLSEIAGREFFDAVVPLDAVEAVIVKARSR
jgi:hypothetical protein